MNAKIHQQLANRKCRIELRPDKKQLGNLKAWFTLWPSEGPCRRHDRAVALLSPEN